MKKVFALMLTIAILSVAAVPSFAQGRECRNRTYYGNSRRDNRVYNDRVYNDQVSNNSRSYYDYNNQNRSFWDKHRDKLTVGAGTLGGAVLGALIGGNKGALIGAAAGAGSSALYTYKMRNRNRPFWR